MALSTIDQRKALFDLTLESANNTLRDLVDKTRIVYIQKLSFRDGSRGFVAR